MYRDMTFKGYCYNHLWKRNLLNKNLAGFFYDVFVCRAVESETIDITAIGTTTDLNDMHET